MSLTFTHIAANIANTVAATSYTSPSFTPVADRLYLVAAVWSPQVASGGQISGITSTTGLTFGTVFSNLGFEGGSPSPFACGLYRAMKSSGLSTGTYTVVFASGNRTACCAFLIEVQGMLTTGTDGADAIGNTNTATGTSTTPTAALTFASANNGTFAIGATSNRTAPSGSNLTLIGGDPDIGTPDEQVFGGYHATNEANPSFTIGSDSWGFICAEIIAAGAAAGQPTMKRWGGTPHVGGRQGFGRSGGGWG